MHAQSLLLLHPFPRVDEITPDVDQDARAMYFKQPQYGMYMRMALLASVLGKEGPLL
jgi:aspartate carbamoyltransferase catalytic subunit